MTYEEFKDNVLKLVDDFNHKLRGNYYESVYICDDVTCKREQMRYPLAGLDRDDTAVIHTWETGGMTGGNCYGDEAYSYTQERSEDADNIIEFILDSIQPDISYLSYRKLVNSKDIIKNVSYSEHEYYGNYTDYQGVVISIKRLYEFLQGLKVDD